ncbi:hypothetical protein N7481_000459 [Penicillium waksmanii]|uniref:uncharacterized protein n=1 Tax=Penicillium waksmanii TaxID=69791 RepID=UPI00254870D5|nr:uncharacterized protein N7481_000459 [Penicillium waksmanii]KAJ6000050.1 hypothetical protein N7481_000459 [Penicillium waksmanii]
MATLLRLRPSGLSRQLQSFSKQPTLAARYQGSSSSRHYATSDRLPKIADTSVWTAMIPRFIRHRKPRDPQSKSKEWNPATFYIVIFTLIGSQAIRMLTLKNDYTAYRRSTDAKIELLKEVIERVKRGEKVDVEKLLGTGDEAQEKEWEDVLREIEEEDSLWHRKDKKEPAQQVEEPTQPIQKSQPKESTTPSTEETKHQSPRKTRFF